MRTCNTVVLFRLACLIFACSNDESENEEAAISIDAYSEGYNYEACWAELRGTIRITGSPTEWGYRLDLSTFESTFFCTSSQELRSEAVGAIYNGEIFIFGGLERDLDPNNFTRALSFEYSFEL